MDDLTARMDALIEEVRGNPDQKKKIIKQNFLGPAKNQPADRAKD